MSTSPNVPTAPDTGVVTGSARVVAIDGPAGTGKSTVSKLLAGTVGAQCLDTGAMYRAVTLAALDLGVPLDDPAAIAAAMADVDVDVIIDADGTNRVFLNDSDVSDRIRTAEVSAAVSAVSAVPEVRTKLVALQRKVSRDRFVVIEGRDVGTVVFPDAGLRYSSPRPPKRALSAGISRTSRLGQPSSYDGCWRRSTGVIISIRPGRCRRCGRPTTPSSWTPATSPSTRYSTNWLAWSTSGSNTAVTDNIDTGLTVAGDGTWSDETDWEISDLVDGDELGTRGPVPVVAIVGRPNVGKSTLVNRILGRREAVVEDIPGVTRDRVSYAASWSGRRFTVVDTGGWEPDAKGLQQAVAAQAELAMKTADAIVVVVDATVGATSTDEAVAKVLRRSKTPVILVANKIDSERREAEAAALWSLGLGSRIRCRGARPGRRRRARQDLEVLPKPRVRQQPWGPAPGGAGQQTQCGQELIAEQTRIRAVGGRQCCRHHRRPGGRTRRVGGKTWQFIDTRRSAP